MIEKLCFNITYQTVTSESVEYGDFEDSGFEHENITFDDFTDLINYIESNGFSECSCSPYNGVDENVWFSTPFEIEDYQTMEEKSISIHPNNSRSARYLKKAIEYSN